MFPRALGDWEDGVTSRTEPVLCLCLCVCMLSRALQQYETPRDHHSLCLAKHGNGNGWGSISLPKQDTGKSIQMGKYRLRSPYWHQNITIGFVTARYIYVNSTDQSKN